MEYHGYPIEQLAEKENFLGTAYLLTRGELAKQDELDRWVDEITHHTFIPETVKKFMDGFRYDAHPMGVFVSTVAALSTFYPHAKNIQDPESRVHAIYRLITKAPTIAAFAYRHMKGLPYVYPDNDLSYSGNFLSMMFKTTELQYKPFVFIKKDHWQNRFDCLE